MRFFLLLSAFLIAGKTFSQLQYVNPLMGTDSKPELSNGNTYPAVGMPWGMNLWTPQTNVMGHGWTYQYSAEKIRGFKQTHQPSPWMNDYGQFTIMPITGKKTCDQEERASWFSHKAEISQPNYYSVYLADHDVTAELTPTERCATLRFTFPETQNAYVVIDAFDRGSYIKIIPEERKIIGYSTRYSRGKLTNFRNYFVIVADHDFTSADVWDGKAIADGVHELTSDHSGAIVGFQTSKGEVVNLKVASSFISFEQAELSLSREIGNKSFDDLHEVSTQRWNEILGRAEIMDVQNSDIDKVRTFYSCLYRTVFFPNKLYELDASNNPVHWSPYNGKILPGRMFAGTGFWDTFRALYPLLNLLYPEINREMQEGLVNDYLEGGFLPEWSSPGYADIMIGNNSASVVADAYIKGIRGYDINRLFEALLHDANNEGPVSAVGREGVDYYNKLGYVPYDVKIDENAARTLEYAYDDFAIYQLAKALGRPKKELELYAKRCRNYRNLFDPSTGLMRGKNADGTFQQPFNPFKWGDAFTEGNSWHYTWSVFHDIAGLMQLMGGKKPFVAKLDSVFALPPVYDDSYYGGMIHEIKEMQIADMGQYAHGNQPIQHMIYLYIYAGASQKTQYWVREAMNRLYKAAPDGYCGDEDNGQTSAWYIFSALGFYPVCPATNEYVFGAPLFSEVRLHLPNGKTTVIKASNNSDANRYWSQCALNGASYAKSFIAHEVLTGGCDLQFNMTDKRIDLPDTKENLPYSFSTHEVIK